MPTRSSPGCEEQVPSSTTGSGFPSLIVLSLVQMLSLAIDEQSMTIEYMHVCVGVSGWSGC